MKTVDALNKSRTPRIGFFGFGKSNEAVYNYLKDCGYTFDPVFRFSGGFPTELNVPCDSTVFSGVCAEALIDENVLFLSPSVRRDSPALTEAIGRGVTLSSDTELFFEKLTGDAIGVTGSDGKSTTTYLIASTLKHDFGAMPVGNFGVGAVSVLGKCAMPVVELSSFQLSYCKPRLRRAVITNISENHLNWHRDLDEYIDAKMNILAMAKEIIYDFDSPIVREKLKGGSVFCVVSLDFEYSQLLSLGVAENIVTFKNDTIYLNDTPFIHLGFAKRKEEYNIRNYMLTVGACIGLCDKNRVREAILSFGGLPHRGEIVGEIGCGKAGEAEGVFEKSCGESNCLKSGSIKIINSSIDTTPTRTLATLKSLRGGEVALILDGRSKGGDYSELISRLDKLTCGVILCGEVGEEIYKILSSRYEFKDYSYKECANIKSAITEAARLLPKGGYILYSPSGTSFDRFKNFEERGEAFRLAARELCDGFLCG